MRRDSVRDGFRKEIAKRSIQVLRSRGMGDADVKVEMARDFALDETEIEELLDAERRK